MSKATVKKFFEFAAAHHLKGVPPEHPCASMHGHTWRVGIEVRGQIAKNGFVIDFRDISAIVKPYIEDLDHSVLNAFVDNPTSENLAMYLYMELRGHLADLTAVEIWESPTSCCRITEHDLSSE